MRESLIEKKVCDMAKGLGVLPIKIVAPNFSGLPDRLFLYKGRVLFVEFKAEGKKPRKLQLAVMRRLRSHGFIVTVCDNVASGYELVEAFTERADDE